MQETHMLKDLTHGWDDNPARSLSLHKNAYIDPAWLAVDKREIFHKSWQFLCHEEKLAKAESNADQVAKIRRIVEDLSLRVATPEETRERLQLKGGDAVAF
jgi:hypothetical protein